MIYLLLYLILGLATFGFALKLSWQELKQEPEIPLHEALGISSLIIFLWPIVFIIIGIGCLKMYVINTQKGLFVRKMTFFQALEDLFD